jgi:primosomal protein N' (replication factor Y)
MIKIPQNVPLTPTKKTIQKILNSFDMIAHYRSIKVTVNVDFY